MTDQDRLVPAQRRGLPAPAPVPLRRQVEGLAAAPELPPPVAVEPEEPARGPWVVWLLVVLLLTAAAGEGAAALVLRATSSAHRTALASGAGAGAAAMVLLLAVAVVALRRRSSSAR